MSSAGINAGQFDPVGTEPGPARQVGPAAAPGRRSQTGGHETIAAPPVHSRGQCPNRQAQQP